MTKEECGVQELDTNNNHDACRRIEQVIEYKIERLEVQEHRLSKLLWDPEKSAVIDQKSSKQKEFQSLIETKYNVKFDNYNQFHEWSVRNFVEFWQEFWHFSGIVYSRPYERVFDKPADTPVGDIPFKWFDGALLNYAENLLTRFADPNQVAVYSYGEAFRQVKSITFGQLRQRVARYQSALKKLGVGKNDIVAGYMPNCIESLEAKLAANSLGAIWTCASPDFGSHVTLKSNLITLFLKLYLNSR